MNRDWLVLGAMAFGVGFSVSLPFTRNLKDSALAGLVAIPATTCGVFFVNRRKERALSLISATLHAEVQALEQHKEELNQSLEALRERQIWSEKHSTRLNDEIASLEELRRIGELQRREIQQEIVELEQEKQFAQQSVKALVEQQQVLEKNHEDLEAKIAHLQSSISEGELKNLIVKEELTKQEARRKTIEEQLILIEGNIKEKELEKELLQRTCSNIQQQQELVSKELEELERQKEKIQMQLGADNRQKSELERELLEIKAQKSLLIRESNEQLISIKSRRQELQWELTTLEEQKVFAQDAIKILRDQQELCKQRCDELDCRIAHLKEQISIDEKQSLDIQKTLAGLEKRRRLLEENILVLHARVEEFKQQRQSEEQIIIGIQQERELGNAELEIIRRQRRLIQERLDTESQQRDKNQQDILELEAQRDSLKKEIQKLEKELQVLKPQESESYKDPIATALLETHPPTETLVSNKTQDDQGKSSSGIAPIHISEPIRIDRTANVESKDHDEEGFPAPVKIKEFRLAEPEHTRWLWEDVIDPRWQYPRYLGSVCLPRHEKNGVWGSETILDLVGENLKRLGTNNLDFSYVYDRFDDRENQNWLKIITFALSEFAYYQEPEESFWKGLCDRLGLPYKSDNAIPVPTLKALAEDGIDLLQLPKAEGGYQILSTLWLQSGIPNRNLNHFAELAEDLVTKSDWSYLLNRDTDWLADQLLEICRKRYPGRTVLRRFLENKPISGQLLQSIARVAVELQKYNLQPQDVLLDLSRRQEFLLNNVPFSFFLRDWHAVVQILTPPAQRNQRCVGEKPLVLMLDTATLQIKLILPEQILRDQDWLPGNCYIQEAGWRGEINTLGQIEIPECTQIIEKSTEGWHWHLLNKQSDCLRSWSLEGITEDFNCLIFDAWTGERLLPSPELTGSEEVFCFAPAATAIDISGEVELAEEGLPCSIREWRGKRLCLTGQTGSLQLQEGNRSILLNWTVATAEPKLRGLRLQGKNAAYLEVPTLWYPPLNHSLPLTLKIQEQPVNNNPPLTQHSITIPESGQWLAIPLNQWIQKAGHYSVSLTTTEQEWSQTFEIQPHYQASADDVAHLPQVVITDTQGTPIHLPLTVSHPHEFWSTTLLITGLWPLELIRFLLSDGQDQYTRSLQANASGQLSLELSTLYDSLTGAKQYFLDYQRLGRPPQRLARWISPSPLSPRKAKMVFEDDHVE